MEHTVNFQESFPLQKKKTLINTVSVYVKKKEGARKKT